MSTRTSPAHSPDVRPVLIALALAAAAACGSPGDSDDGDSPTPEPGDTLEVLPSLARLEVVNNVAASQAFTVSLVKPSGTRFDVTDDVRWALSDPLIGSFTDATFTARGGSAGLATATATLDIASGAASIEVFVRGVRVGTGAPANAPDLFAGGTLDPAQAPEIAYPPDEVIVPHNLGDLEVHWRDAHAHDLFELSMVNDHVDLKVYLPGTGATGYSSFQTAEWYAASMGGDEITVGLRALTIASPATFGAAPPRKVKLTNTDLEGGLYYWAATAAGGGPYGIFRHDFGTPDQPAEPVYTTTEAGRCVACHVLSRDGTKMTITYAGGNGDSTIIDVATRTPMVPAMQQYWNFGTYSPDGARLVTSRMGTLTVRDGTTAAPIAGANGTVPTGAFASHPDFSPLGNLLVYARATNAMGSADWHLTGAEIATIPYDPATGAWGTPTTIITGGGINYYPSVSPDGQWVLFNRSTEDAYDDGTAELWVARIDGTGARKLDLANIGPNLTNSWARWAPFRTTFGPDGATEDAFWITWSTKRDFGVRLVGVRRPQLWMSPFFPGRVAAGGDPTAPAFRLPFQDINSNNHIAQWTEVVVPIGKIQQTPVRAAPAAGTLQQ